MSLSLVLPERGLPEVTGPNPVLLQGWFRIGGARCGANGCVAPWLGAYALGLMDNRPDAEERPQLPRFR